MPDARRACICPPRIELAHKLLSEATRNQFVRVHFARIALRCRCHRARTQLIIILFFFWPVIQCVTVPGLFVYVSTLHSQRQRKRKQ